MGKKPSVASSEMLRLISDASSDRDTAEQKRLARFAELASKGKPFRWRHQGGSFAEVKVENLYMSICYACGDITVWCRDIVIYPTTSIDVDPAADMPDDVRGEFIEAAAIVQQSPRGAAALLRLAVQKLMPHLGENGGNINDDIQSLVAKGLKTSVQQALDIVRVTGNNAVHPGKMDLKDDYDTAYKLFKLVNMIVESMITEPRQLKDMFGALPPGALKAIQKRDS
ncbi:DUF4145 domain-containing protein [Methylobacterium sp. Leaf99]|uniref:DUF4145 domain-containing protein n=1 Tax=Methylobacterium sp. Leaf99 TaxID=1736251 RepID=UPI00138EE562|nr:DUF4145 domain-containing protein [Methylobacterium sp. Leaf99]